ncbi:PstS family phosphate ABC transporter substrate-binding protein [Streptomyces albidoflavus]|uniref:PstS family phosphate ABC transporter substrate-binding protein n=1 Tax=Streptomyces albidoflavus TaxID=1886 RepID=UPI0034032176
MEWVVNAENVIAVGTFAVASSIAFGQWWYERMVPRRRRIGYRVQLDTAIGDDDVHPNESLTPDEKPPVFSRPARLTSMAFLVGIALLAGLIVTGGEPPPMGCATGSLEVTGSTAFAPVAEELAEAYMEQCPGSKITVTAHGSTTGLRELAERGAAAKDGAPGLVALSDGPAPQGQETGDVGAEGGEGGGLAGTRLAVSVFTLLAHADVPVRNLTLADLRRIYAGEVTDWREVGAGRSLSIVLAGRSAASGTRDVLQRRLLDGAFEPPASSRDCSRKDNPTAPVIRCELDTTDQVIATVARVPGALGYSELRTTSTLAGVRRLSLDGRRPSLDGAGHDAHPYREIEYAYTYGRPPADSLTAGFLAFATRGPGQDVVRTHGHLPCGTPEGLRICGAAD